MPVPVEAGFQQYHARTKSAPAFDYYYTTCSQPTKKKTDGALPSCTITRLRFPPRPGVTYHCEATPTNPSCWKRTPQTQKATTWSREGAYEPVHQQTIEEWVNEQVHLTDHSNLNYDTDSRRAQPMGKEELRQRMWDELVYEYEAEAHKWMNHETEMRRRHEREREEARRRIVLEDIMRIQARVRQRRDSEREAIAEERKRSAERAKEKVRKEQARAERAMLEAWNVYESRWAAVSATSSSEPLGFHDIPWPVLVPPTGAADLTPEHITEFLLSPIHSTNHSRRDRIRTALLRWHPDRFGRILGRVVDEERSMVEECAGVIIRCLNNLLAKEANRILLQER